MTKDDKEIVSALRAALADKVGQDRYDVWLGDDTPLAWSGGVLRILAPNAIAADFIRRQLRHDLESVAASLLGRSATIEITVSDEPPPTIPMTPTRDAADKEDCGGQGDAPDHSAEDRSAAAESRPGRRSPKAVGKKPAAAAPRNTPVRSFSRLDDFVVGASNRLAWTTAGMVAERLGSYSPLFIHGPTGVGKTHLLEGICLAARQPGRGVTAVFLSAEQFLSQFQDALRGAGMPSFRRKYRGVELLILDDVQFLVGKTQTVAELLHTVDAMLRDGRQVVFSADRPPAELTDLGPELLGRIQGGMTCRLDPPEFEVRRGIVRRLAAERRLDVPDEVARYVAAHVATNARELNGAINVLELTSKAFGEPVTLRMAQDALAELVTNTAKIVRLADIEHAVCDVFGLEPSALQSSRKGKDVSQPRMLAMWLARKHTRAALIEIGRHFGRSSHATVSAAQSKVDVWIAERAPLSCAGRDWSLEETVRRIEQKLAM